MKKILFLGASYAQIPAIKYAKDKGLLVYTTDNIPENPGHQFATKSYGISTIDKQAILQLSINLNIDAICAYGSDPSAQTAAYVSEKLGLRGNKYETIKILTDKEKFRLFLKKKNYLTPDFFSSSSYDEIKKQMNEKKKYILKPVDSSGSKGVFVINNKNDLDRYFSKAISFSRRKRVILEEYIMRKGPQIHGEGFVESGKLLFLSIGDQYFSFVNSVVPYSTLMQTYYHQDLENSILEMLDRFIKDIGFKQGGFNFEIIRSIDENLFLLEFGPRNGGNFMPQLVKYSYGVDLVSASIDVLIDEKIEFQKYSTLEQQKKRDQFFSQIIIHADQNGYLVDYVNKIVGAEIVEKFLYKKPGEFVSRYRNSKDVLGVYILKIKNNDVLKNYLGFLRKTKFVVISKTAYNENFNRK